MAAPVDVVVLTVIPAELRALQDALGLDPARRERSEHGSVFQRTSLPSELLGRSLNLVLGCVGEAGNAPAASAATEMIATHHPRAVLLMGIAAGLREKTRIGEVVLSDRVVAYEPAALVRTADGRSVTQPRPEIERAPHAILQDVTFYRPDARRLRSAFKKAGGAVPEAKDETQRSLFEKHVATGVTARTATIASGEKLLRDPERFRALRELHGKVEVGEMEAAGLVDACRRASLPWLVVRGISDFGDDFKDDAFHGFAAMTAAVVLVDFLRHGYSLGAVGTAESRTGGRQSPFVYGRPMHDDREFVGRQAARDAILLALEKKQPVQLLGLPLMGRSSLLGWVERHAPEGRPMVALNPAKTCDPVSMVRAIATVLGRGSEAEAVHDVVGASALLDRMVPLLLLVDDADALAKHGRDFERGFFDTLRTHTQSGALWWVSTSVDDIETLFVKRGLTSKFLNDSKKVHVGALPDDEAKTLADRGDPLSNTLLAHAGGWARGLQWLGDRRFTRAQEAEDETLDAFANDCEVAFRRWWACFEANDRQTLKTLVPRPTVASLERPTRVRARHLRDLGVANEREGRIGLAGLAWEEFVRGV